MMTAEGEGHEDKARPRYHHGNLRTALLEAAETLIGDHGVERFTIADAARRVGVSTAAPYRHFKDKDDLLAHLAAEGFWVLASTTDKARAPHPSGSIESLVAIGHAYVQFAMTRPELFHLMWGATRPRFSGDEVSRSGGVAYGIFIETVKAVMERQGLEDVPVYEVSTPLWALVHGLASLTLSKTPMIDPDAAALHREIDRATRAYLAGLRAMPCRR